ncbi:3'(2'),5'-bisphosphate nucleotidase CysQ [Pasteurellaceae bacterium LFhippo2]|nr:3'(2'),5'-bisphosphate nucleotidase CysQ [Pasteurellaceae bacterium LFhippo2]
MLNLNQAIIDKVLEITYQAGKHLQDFYARSVEIQIKDDQTPVTEADLFISQFMIDNLRLLTPDIPVLSEEASKIPLSERSQWQQYWIIDPLDGTQQFINRTDQFSIMIGFVQNNQPIFGIIHAPTLNKTYVAMQGQGAYLIEKGQKINLTPNCKDPSETHRLLITTGSSNRKITKNVHNAYQVELLVYGSSSLKAGLVAEGKADCYVRLGDTGEWDTAAAEVLLAETGGKIFDIDFQPLTYNQRETLINPHFVMVGNKDIDWQAIFHFN